MPYYLYAVRPFAQLDKLGEFDAFAQASAQAKTLRTAQPRESAARIRIMFADTALAAEDLLLQVRDASPAGDD